MSTTVEGPASSPFIEIKTGSEMPPVFIAHGLCGLAHFSGLAMHIRTANPIYGIQAKGVDGTEEPLDSVQEMATFYVNELQKLYPADPYILIGYSFGGLVALEMARHLLQTPNKVPLLVLIDTYPHPRFCSRPVRLRLFATRVSGHLKEMRQLPVAAAISYFVDGVKSLLHIPGAGDKSNISPKLKRLGFDETTLLRVKQKAYLAYESYGPTFYPGQIQFVTAQTKSFFPEDPAAVWRHLTANLEIEEIPGNHLNIVTTEFHALAEALTRYIEQVRVPSYAAIE